MPHGTSNTPESSCLNAFAMADLIADPLHIVDAEGVLVFVNASWVKYYGVPAGQVVGKSVQSVIEVVAPLRFYLDVNYADYTNTLSSADLDRLTYTHLSQESSESAALRVLREKRKVSMLTDHLQTGNRLMVTSTPIFNENGEVAYAVTLIQDLSRLSSWRDQLEMERRKNQSIRAELEYLRGTQNPSRLVGTSKAMEAIRKIVLTVAKTDATVLILGESGVGKEVVAQEVYANSLRKDEPFVTINCAAIPEALLESEMFGHERGAFTGATKTKIGFFELADKGTILLDEIGELPLKLQPKLLRALQEREIARVGGQAKIPVNIRIIAVTNQNLHTLIQQGAFRSDLYYRLNVIPIEVPPLRDRKSDIVPLAHTFLEKFNKKYGRDKHFSELALHLLESHPWTGNVRELENAVERMTIIGEFNTISEQQAFWALNLSEEVPEGETGFGDLSLKDAVRKFERRLIQNTLIKHGTTYKAAEILKTSQATVVRKAQALGITEW